MFLYTIEIKKINNLNQGYLNANEINIKLMSEKSKDNSHFV